MEYISLLEGLPRNIFTGSIGYIKQDTGNRTQETGHRKQDTGYRKQDTGNRIQETGHRKQETGNRTQDTGNRTQETAMEMDFNIAIRTVLIKDGYLEFWAGGGIVADSDPEKEYEEALLKAERFLGII